MIALDSKELLHSPNAEVTTYQMNTKIEVILKFISFLSAIKVKYNPENGFYCEVLQLSIVDNTLLPFNNG